MMLPILTFSVMGCNDDNDGTRQEAAQPIVLQGQAYTFDSEEGTIWHNAQEIGVFLTETGKETLCGDYANMKFYADNRNSFGYFVPSGAPVYLNREQTVDVKAYYPYKDISLLTQGTQFIYNIDLSNQKTAKADAFIYADNARSVSKTYYKANLELCPVLSVVILALMPGADLTEDIIKKMAIRLKGMPTTAQFNLLEGEFLETSKAKDNVKTDLSIKSDLTVSIVMLPGEMSRYATIEVTIPAEGDIGEKTMSWSLNNVVQTMERNTQYFVMLKIGSNGVTGELTGQSLIYIQDWGHSDDVNGDAKQNKKTKNIN